MESISSPGAVGLKPAWQSKTLITAAITALLPVLCPPVAAFVAANPEVTTAVLGLVFAGLRLVTNGKVSIK